MKRTCVTYGCKKMKKPLILTILTIAILLPILIIFISPAAVLAEPYNPYTTETEKSILFEKGIMDTGDKYETKIKRDTWVESARGAYTKTSTSFYFSDLTFGLGEIISEEAIFDNEGRPIESSQIIRDPAGPDVSQQRLLSNIEYNQNDKPLSYKEEIFITANDYLTDTMVRLLSTRDVYKVQYSDLGKPISILGNTEVIISDDKGNTLLTIKGSFTKRAKCDLDGKITGFYRYGIDNIVVADGAGEIIITAPPSVTDVDEINEYRVGIVSIKDENYLRQILNNQTFINQLLAKFGLAELFYKAFYTEKFYTSLTYLQIENTPDEIMSLNNITLAFKNLIQERQQAYALFQEDVDTYYKELAKTLFENIDLWWGKSITPQEYYAGNDTILSKQEHRKMIDDAIISLSSSADILSTATTTPQEILLLEQYLRTQMIMNSKLIYIQNLKNAVSTLDKQISLSVGRLDRPVLIHEKDTIEALIVLPEKDSRSFKRK